MKMFVFNHSCTQITSITPEELQRRAEIGLRVCEPINSVIDTPAKLKDAYNKRMLVITSVLSPPEARACVEEEFAETAKYWLSHGVVNSLFANINGGERFRSGNMGSVWLDTTVSGMLPSGQASEREVRVAGYMNDDNMVEMQIDMTNGGPF